MALRLVRWGARLHPNEVTPGNGWVNAVAKGGTKPYMIGAGDFLVTATATGCGGVRIYDWDRRGTPFVESVSSGGLHSVTALISGTSFGPVVRVLNPTENTEVTIMSEPIPPPLLRRIFARLVGWLPWL